MELTKSELHTHLFGMISAKELLKMVSEYVDFIYWPLNKPVDETSRLVSINDLLNNETALKQLRIKHGEQASYGELENYYRTRISIINYLISIFYLSNGKKNCKYNDLIMNDAIRSKISCYYNKSYNDKNVAYIMAILDYVKLDKKLNKEKNDSISKLIYSDYLNRALKELTSMGCKYIEVSYSSENIMSLIELNPDVASTIKCKFLLSTERSRRVKQMEESISSLKEGIKKGMIIGFDIMGQELPLRDDEKSYSQIKNSYSLKRKLELLVEVLKDTKNGINTLRIHSGESKTSFGNTEWILNTLLEIKSEYESNNSNEKILPPPEIRIGHGIYFDKNNNYLKMLQQLGVVIEINASSNFALGNIDNYITIPYDYYLENNIPIVISTDGHGLYDTSLKVEDYIASEVSKYYKIIPRIEDKIIEGKIKR
ncbi:MAG: hypothetical protein IKX00_02540 [Bacilli bacterium]|nr:hypothetical protein [Bacilli bacterium]